MHTYNFCPSPIPLPVSSHTGAEHEVQIGCYSGNCKAHMLSEQSTQLLNQPQLTIALLPAQGWARHGAAAAKRGQCVALQQPRPPASITTTEYTA